MGSVFHGGLMDSYQVKLIEIADELARLGMASIGAGDEQRYLRRFRTIYQHLATTVETSQGGAMPNPMMGMDPFTRTPEQVRDMLDKTEGNLRELDR
jgi:hypothetical protein